MNIYESLFKYYSVTTVEELVAAQSKHISTLQKMADKYKNQADMHRNQTDIYAPTMQFFKDN